MFENIGLLDSTDLYPYKPLSALGPKSGQLYTPKSIEQLGPKRTAFNKQLPQMPLAQQASADTFLGLSQGGWDAAGSLLGGLGSLGNIAVGFKGLGLMEDQLDLAKDQWGETKQELNRLRQTRDKLNSSYMA